MAGLTPRELGVKYGWSARDVRALAAALLGTRHFNRRDNVAAHLAAEAAAGTVPKGLGKATVDSLLKLDEGDALTRRLIELDMVDEVTKRVRANPDNILKFPPTSIRCMRWIGCAAETTCGCFEVEEHITPLGVALSRGHGVRAAYHAPPNLVVLKALLECGADPNRCWSQRKSKRKGGELSDWVAVHPLKGAKNATLALLMLLAYGARPPTAKMTRKLTEANLLSPPRHWLRRFNIVHFLPPATETEIVRLLILARECRPSLHRDVVGIVARLLALP